MRVAHLSDLHLGRRMPGEQRAAKRFNSFQTAMTKLANESPDVLLIAGDVFDGPQVDRALVEATARVFNGVRKPSGQSLPAVVIPGNHDPADATGLWRVFADSLGPGSSVRLVLEPKLLKLCDARLLVEAYPCETRYSPEPPWARRLELPAETEGRVHVVLAHGTLQGGPVPEGESDAYPFNQEDAETLGADYVALGHFHAVYLPWSGGEEIERSLCYCGAHEPTEFGSDGGWALLATLEQGRPARLRRVRVGSAEWRVVEIAGPTDLQDLRALQDEVENNEDPASFIIRIKRSPKGILSEDEADEQQRIVENLEVRGAQVDQRGEFQTLVNIESIDLDSLPAGAVKEALVSLREEWQETQNADEREVLATALQLGWQEFKKKE